MSTDDQWWLISRHKQDHTIRFWNMGSTKLWSHRYVDLRCGQFTRSLVCYWPKKCGSVIERSSVIAVFKNVELHVATVVSRLIRYVYNIHIHILHTQTNTIIDCRQIWKYMKKKKLSAPLHMITLIWWQRRTLNLPYHLLLLKHEMSALCNSMLVPDYCECRMFGIRAW